MMTTKAIASPTHSIWETCDDVAAVLIENVQLGYMTEDEAIAAVLRCHLFKGVRLAP